MTLGLPYGTDKPTRQVQGRITEQRILQGKGARAHANSGAGRNKDDGSDDQARYEIKDAMKSYAMKGKELLDLWRRSNREHKRAEFIVYFTEADVTVTCVVTKGRG